MCWCMAGHSPNEYLLARQHAPSSEEKNSNQNQNEAAYTRDISNRDRDVSCGNTFIIIVWLNLTHHVHQECI